jgi:hypothetical protein
MLVLNGGRQEDTAAASAEASPRTSVGDALLEEARTLFEKGDVFAAHAKLLEVPEGSEARQSPIFRDIEGEWANAMIEAAAGEDNVDAKRALLDQIARSTTVDAMRRKRAAKLLEQLPQEGLAIDELPEGASPPVPMPEAAASALHAEAAPTAVPQAAPPRPVQTQPAPKRPVKAPAPPPLATEKSPTLVRDDPFGPSKSNSTGSGN